MNRLVVTVDAEADTDNILSHLEREAGAVIAEECGRRFRIAIERIVDLPGTGAPRPALGQNARIAIVFPFVLVYDYTPENDTVVLLRIPHGRRDISRRLLHR